MAIDRIDGSGNVGRPERPENEAQAPARRSESAEGASADRVELSPEARRIAALADRAKALPEIREEKVEAIRQRLVQGTYAVDARRVARAMLEFEDGLAR